MIDSHCHLADQGFNEDLADVVTRARDAGVERALVILAAGDAQEAAQADRIETLWPEVRRSVGVHPHSAHEFQERPERVVEIVRDAAAAMPSARAIGEIGLDYHYGFSEKGVQRKVFRFQLQLARELRRPVVIHTREADEDTVAILREEQAADVGGVLHCFTGTPELAKAALDLGFYISLAGIITFPKAEGLRDTARGVPLDRLLTETDSPFLAPVPHRGKRNEPAHVAQVVRAVADLHGLSPGDVAARTAANFHTLFRP